MDGSGGHEGMPGAIDFLFGSEKRVQLLASMEDGPRRQTAVADDCDVGHSTVHRTVEGFRQRGWVHERGDGYALTAMGERVLSAYRSFADSVERVVEYEPLFACLEGTGVSVPDAVLAADADTELVTACEHDIHAPLVTVADVLRRADADRVRTAWSGVSPITNDAGADRLARGKRVEMVVDRRTLEVSRESYFENYQLALASDRVDLHVTSDPFDVGVLLAGERVAVTGSEDGRVTVCLHGTGDELRRWAADLYERVRSRADPVEVRYPAPDETPPGTDDRAPSTPTPDGGYASGPD